MDRELMKINNLEELFEIWRKDEKKKLELKLKIDEKLDLEDKFKEIAEDSFTPDGYIDKDAWYAESDKRVLFVAREAHLTLADYDEEHKEQIFWFKEVVLCNRKGNGYKNYINKIYETLFKEDTINESENLKHVAYMNLNKRGGTDSQMDKYSKQIMDAYCQIYKPYIKREIEILQPKYIVALGISGKWTGEYVEEILDVHNDNIGEKAKIGYNLINLCHPSYPGKYSRIENGINKSKEI